MTFTLLDEHGEELTEVTSHLGRSAGHMLVDWATRPDLLFHYYFDRGSRTVTAMIDAAKWSAKLGTRWQMGERFWFLHELLLIEAPVATSGQMNFTPACAPGTAESEGEPDVSATGAQNVPTLARQLAQRGITA
jgi:hypothetical protein